MRTRSLARPEPAEKSPDRLAHSAFLDDAVTLRHFLAHIAEGVYITTPNDVLRDANPAFLEIFGAQSLKDLEGQPFRELLIDSGVREQQRLALAESGRIVDFELEIRRSTRCGTRAARSSLTTGFSRT
ncbi:MAG: PAS domain-containing protein [Woeseiaceae bacterium]